MLNAERIIWYSVALFLIIMGVGSIAGIAEVPNWIGYSSMVILGVLIYFLMIENKKDSQF